MSDLSHVWGGDLRLSASGDLAGVAGAPYGTERVIRRLLTNPGDYVWHPEYGAGLARFVGETTDARAIEALVRSQMALERAVAATPPPTVGVSPFLNGVTVAISYTDRDRSERVGFTLRVAR